MSDEIDEANLWEAPPDDEGDDAQLFTDQANGVVDAPALPDWDSMTPEEFEKEIQAAKLGTRLDPDESDLSDEQTEAMIRLAKDSQPQHEKSDAEKAAETPFGQEFLAHIRALRQADVLGFDPAERMRVSNGESVDAVLADRADAAEDAEPLDWNQLSDQQFEEVLQATKEGRPVEVVRELVADKFLKQVRRAQGYSGGDF